MSELELLRSLGFAALGCVIGAAFAIMEHCGRTWWRENGP